MTKTIDTAFVHVYVYIQYSVGAISNWLKINHMMELQKCAFIHELVVVMNTYISLLLSRHLPSQM